MIFALIFLTLFVRFNTFIEGSEDVDLEIVDFYSCDMVGNPQYYFPIETTAYFNVTMKNLIIDPKNVSIYLGAKDEVNQPIGWDELNTAIPANASVYYIMEIFIPKWACVGNATAKVLVYEGEIVIAWKTTNFCILPEDNTPPVVCILSPENLTYTTSSIPLIFTVNERTFSIGYSLDYLENVTIAGNTTLTDLSNGSHSIIVYANDTSGNTGSSNRVYFTVSVVHDVAVVDVNPSPIKVHIGQIINITVVAQNDGTAAETFNVTVYHNGTVIETQTVINLPPANQTTLTFRWNTTNITPGNYTIVAQASLVLGESDVADNTYIDGTVKIIKNPVAHFTYSPPNPRVCELVTFNASSSTPDGGSIVLCRWDFGDGNVTTLSDPIITHHYITFGNFMVILTVIDSDNLTDSETVTVNVRMHPDASFVYSPSQPLAGEPVLFNASTSTPNGGSIIWFDWDFGDGYVASESDAIITHIYTLPGTYSVTLTVTDSEELSNTAWKQIPVYTHDIAITNVTTSKSIVGQGYSMRINVVATNQGNYTEEINVTVYCNTTNPIATQIITLTGGNSTTLTFTWNTSGFVKGNYTITAEATQFPYETDTTDNTLTDGTVLVTIPGDVNGDRVCDMEDIVAMILAFQSKRGADGKYRHTPPCKLCPHDPNIDTNCDGIIDMKDIVTAILHFSQKW